MLVKLLEVVVFCLLCACVLIIEYLTLRYSSSMTFRTQNPDLGDRGPNSRLPFRLPTWTLLPTHSFLSQLSWLLGLDWMGSRSAAGSSLEASVWRPDRRVLALGTLASACRLRCRPKRSCIDPIKPPKVGNPSECWWMRSRPTPVPRLTMAVKWPSSALNLVISRGVHHIGDTGVQNGAIGSDLNAAPRSG